MPIGCLLTICFAGSLIASVAFSQELPPIPENAGLGIATTSMTFSMVCDMRYKRPRMVADAKALFLKFARKEFKDPQAAMERAFKAVRRDVAREHATAANHHTVQSCDRLARMLKRELAR